MTDQKIVPERAECAAAIEALHEATFGPGRFARAAFRLREEGPHDPDLSFVALAAYSGLLGSVRMTPVRLSASDHRGWLLGPLAVLPAAKNRGIGKGLVRHAVAGAAARGEGRFVILVGDLPYYAPFGFVAVPAGRVWVPGPVDPKRLLVHPLGDDGLAGALEGRIGHDGPRM